MDDDKMVETAMRTAFIEQHELTLPAWINDHKKTSAEEMLATDYDEQITLWDMIKIVAQIVPIALLICVVWAAWA